MKRLPSLVATLAFLLLFGAVSRPAEAQTCTAGQLAALQANWNIVAPTTNSDGTPLTLSVTFDLYTATVATGAAPPASSAYTKTAGALGPATSGASLTYTQTAGLVPNVTVYGYVVTTDANGQGAPSAVACKSFPQENSPPGKAGLSVS